MGNIFCRVIRMLAIHQDESFLTIIFESLNLCNYLIIGECFTHSLSVRDPEATILAVVGAPVPDIERSKEYNSVPINILLQFTCPLPYLINKISPYSIYKHCGLFHGQPVLSERFGNNFTDPDFIGPGIVDEVPYFVRINERFHPLIRNT